MKRKFPIVYVCILLVVLLSIPGYALVILSSNFPDVGFGINISGTVQTDTPITDLTATITNPDGVTVNVTGVQLSNSTHWGIVNYTTFVNGTHNISLEVFDGVETANGTDSFDARAFLDNNIDVERDVYFNYFVNTSVGEKIYISGEEVDLRAPESNLTNVSYRLYVNYSPEINTELDVELVWIIDSTGSMQPHVSQVKGSIDGFLSELNTSGISVRHGLVTYKDLLSEQDEFAQTSDDTTFSGYINSILFQGGKDSPENPYLAMHTAIGNGTSYDFKESAYKYMIFITDQSAHTPDSQGDAGADALYSQNETIDLLNEKGFKLMTSTFASRFELYGPMSAATDGEIYELGQIEFFLDDIADTILNDTVDARSRTQPYVADVQFVNFTGDNTKTVRELVEEDITMNPDTVFPTDLYTNVTYTIHGYDVIIMKANAPDGTEVADLITYKFALNESGDPINGTNISAVENSSIFFFYPNLIYYSYVYNKGDVDVGFCLNIIIEYFNETSMDYQFHETIYEANDTYGAVVGEYVSYNELWREQGFNTINSPAGQYRAVAEVRDHEGNLITDSEGTELRTFSDFLINETDVTCVELTIDGDAEFSEPVICENIIIENGATVGVISNGSFIAGTMTVRGNSIINGSRINITAGTLNIEAGSVITTVGKGFGVFQGPGYDASDGRASHGGRCGQSTCETYGSVYQPTTLGSGGRGAAGGGAVKLITTVFDNNGTVTSNGGFYFFPTPGCGVLSGGSGGSILIDTGTLRGNGGLDASGGTTKCGASQYGGGGRIAVYYNETTWNLTNFSQINVHDGYVSTASPTSEPGTVIAIDKNDNEAFITGTFQFSHNYTNGSEIFDEIRLDTGTIGYNFSKVTLKSLYQARYEFNDTFYAEELYIVNTSLSGSSNLIVEDVNMTLFDSSTLSLDAYVQNNSAGTVILQNATSLNAGWINLTLDNLIIDTTSVLSSQDKGFDPFTGPGYLSASDGGSYGGRCADSDCIRYGSAYQPLQFGSGGGGSNGGGAVILFINNITLDGIIGSDGGNFFDFTPSCSVISLAAGSGGSVFMVVDSLEGTGTIEANGGLSKCGISRYGAGGRIAVYYNSSSWEDSNFSQINVSETYVSTDVDSADPGTGIAINMIENTAFILGSFDFNTTYFDGTEQQNETRYDTGTNDYNFTRMTLQDGKDMSYYSPSLFKSDELFIINSTFEDSQGMSIEAYDAYIRNSNFNIDFLQFNDSFGALVIRNSTIDTDTEVLFSSTNITLQDSIMDFFNLTINVSDRGRIIINGTSMNADTLRFGKVSLYNDNVSIYNSTIDAANFTMVGDELRVDADSLITTEGKGYAVEQGPGFIITGTFSERRASHGGSCFGSACQEYGNAFQPIQHGSGGGRALHPEFSGGGVIRIDTERLVLDGNLTADGGDGGFEGFTDGSGSGGSIFITTTYLEGATQNVTANGGFIGDIRTAGGGGRIAIYYNESTWNESTFYRIETGQYSDQKVIFNAPHAGSVVAVNRSDNSVRIADGFTFQSTYLNGSDEFTVTRWDNESINTFPSLVIRNATNLVVLNDTVLTSPYVEVNNATWYGRTSNLTLNASTLLLTNVTFNFTTLLSLRIDNISLENVVFDENLELELFNEQFGSVRWTNGFTSAFENTLEAISIQQERISVDTSLVPELNDDASLLFKILILKIQW